MQNKKLCNVRILVTGGAGFIGSNLVETFLQNGNEVVCLDNFSTGKKENIKEFLSHKKFSFFHGDIRNIRDCRKAVAGVDYVFHQAALGSVPRSVKDPHTTHEVNVNGFLNMLIASKEERVRRFIYASSSSVYGDTEELPKKENFTGTPLSPYAVTKIVNEKYATVFSSLYGIETVGLRYFNVFGKKQNPEGEYAAVIPRFISQLLAHRSPVIYGDGNQTRDFTHVDNVTEANQLAALVSAPEALNTVYNVACGEQTSLNELFHILVDLLCRYDESIASVKPQYAEPRQGDIRNSFASVEKAEKKLGYKPLLNIRQGLEKTIDGYYHALKMID